MNTTSSLPRTALRISAYLLALVGVLQAVLALIFLTTATNLKEVHGYLGMAAIVIAAVAVVSDVLWMRQLTAAGASATPARALLAHAAGMAVVAVIQVGLGEAHLEAMHIGLGVAFLVGAVALAIMVSRPADRSAA